MPITFGNRDHTKDYWYIEGQKDLRAELTAQTEAKIQKERAKAEAEKTKAEAAKANEEAAKANAEAAKANEEAAKANEKAANMKAEVEKNDAIENFLSLGLTPEIIAEAMKVAVEKILAIQEKTNK